METANDAGTTNPFSNPNISEQVAAFQRIWLETISKLVQTAAKLPPESAPPEVLREMRNGVFQGLAKSWDEFLRSPQFLQSMKQWMDNAIAMRKLTNDFLTQAHHEMQGTAREDIDNVMLAVRHMEKRLLDRIEQLEGKLEAAQGREKGEPAQNGGSMPKRAGTPRQTRPSTRKAGKTQG